MSVKEKTPYSGSMRLLGSSCHGDPSSCALYTNAYRCLQVPTGAY